MSQFKYVMLIQITQPINRNAKFLNKKSFNKLIITWNDLKINNQLSEFAERLNLKFNFIVFSSNTEIKIIKTSKHQNIKTSKHQFNQALVSWLRKWQAKVKSF